jgi:plastocyanin
MRLRRTGISTIVAAAVVVVVLVAAGGAYILYSQAGGMTGNTSNMSSHATTTASSSASSGGGALNVVMNIPASVILASADVVANYTMTVVVVGTLESPLTLGAQVPGGVTVLFQPTTIQPNQQSTDVQVSIKVSSGQSGSYTLNVTATAPEVMGTPGASYSQGFSLHLVQYLVVTTGATFEPGSISVPAGSTVEWIRLNGAIDQYDNGAHNVVFNDGMASSATLAQYDTYSYTFSTQGTFDYHCTFHASMQGTVVVT